MLCEWKRQQLASFPLLSLSFIRLIDGYKSEQSRLDSQFPEFDLVKDTAFLLRALKAAAVLFLYSTLSYLGKWNHLPPFNEIFFNYSFSSLVLITFPFRLSSQPVSQECISPPAPPPCTIHAYAFIFLKMLFVVGSCCQIHYN